MITPEKNIDSTAPSSKTRENTAQKLTPGELFSDIKSYIKFLQTQIQKEFEDIQKLLSYYSRYSKSMLLGELNIEKRLENLGVFIKNFSTKYDYGVFKTTNIQLKEGIDKLQKILDKEFEELKKSIYREIDKNFK